MWSCLWHGRPEEEVPIGHITNGVHALTWLAPEMQEVYNRYLDELELADTLVRCDHLTALATSKSVRSLRLTRCRPAERITLEELSPLPLRELSLIMTQFEPALTRELAAKHWPGCLVTLPDGRRFKAQ